MRRIASRQLALYSRLVTFRPNLPKIVKCANLSHDMATDVKFLSEPKSNLKDIFHAAVRAVSPCEIIRRKVKLQDNTLYINERSFPLRQNVYLVGFGKAVMGMAVELERVLGSVLKRGIVSIPSISKDLAWTSEDKSCFPKLHNSAIEYREGSVNNQPDSRSLDTTHDIIDLVEKLTETDTLIVLVSGGGSALLYMPRPILDQEDKLELCKRLQNAGADITELNIVRRKLSLVKGGGLARMAYPASVVALILSDIIGDPIDLIASGPTVYSAKAPGDVIAVLKKYNLYRSLEGDLKTAITTKETFDDGPLLNQAKQFKHVTNIILGNNTVALEAASLEASRKSLAPIILRNDIRGDVQDVGLAYARLTSLICLVLLNELQKEEFYDRIQSTSVLPLSIDKIDEIFYHITSGPSDIVLIGGGEPTVVVTGRGKGGRNQELALRFSLDWLAEMKSHPRLAEYNVVMLSAGTDGQDGPTDAAGAFGYAAVAPTMHDLYAKIKSTATPQTSSRLGRKVADENNPAQDSYKRWETDESVIKSEGESLRPSFENLKERLGPIQRNINEHIDPLALKIMEAERMLPENTLKENDTYNFYSRFRKGADLIKTGFTGTNVMDLHLIYIKKRLCGCKIDSSNELKCEDTSDIHDLHIDATTIERYKAIHAPLKFNEDKVFTEEVKRSFPNVRIVDRNLTNVRCDKKCQLD